MCLHGKNPEDRSTVKLYRYQLEWSCTNVEVLRCIFYRAWNNNLNKVQLESSINRNYPIQTSSTACKYMGDNTYEMLIYYTSSKIIKSARQFCLKPRLVHQVNPNLIVITADFGMTDWLCIHVQWTVLTISNICLGCPFHNEKRNLQPTMYWILSRIKKISWWMTERLVLLLLFDLFMFFKGTDHCEGFFLMLYWHGQIYSGIYKHYKFLREMVHLASCIQYTSDYHPAPVHVTSHHVYTPDQPAHTCTHTHKQTNKTRFYVKMLYKVASNNSGLNTGSSKCINSGLNITQRAARDFSTEKVSDCYSRQSQNSLRPNYPPITVQLTSKQ